MKTAKEVTKKSPLRRATSPEAREDQLISLAVDLAEKQLREGTASSSVITHYLKLGSTKEQLEKENLKENTKLLQAKIQALESSKETEIMYREALEAMRSYNRKSEDEQTY